jgi:hypothetical protein
MNPDVAKAALVFLSRVQLQGNEAPALMHVVSVIEGYAAQAPAEPKPATEVKPVAKKK